MPTVRIEITNDITGELIRTIDVSSQTDAAGEIAQEIADVIESELTPQYRLQER